MTLSEKFLKKLAYAPLLSMGLIMPFVCSHAKDISSIKKQKPAMAKQDFSSAANLDANKLIDQLISILDLPLSAINKSSVEQIFGTPLIQLGLEKKPWGVRAEKDWYYHLQVDRNDLSNTARSFRFSFDRGIPPNYKDVPFCIDPKKIADYLIQNGWKYHQFPSLPAHQPFEWYTKDGKKAELGIVGKDDQNTNIRCLASLTLGVSK